jgi:predicted nucleic acid-binding protein
VIVRPELILGAIDLHRLHPLSVWDALIVASASAASCATLLTEDLGAGDVIAGVRIENPFAAAPA